MINTIAARNDVILYWSKSDIPDILSKCAGVLMWMLLNKW